MDEMLLLEKTRIPIPDYTLLYIFQNAQEIRGGCRYD